MTIFVRHSRCICGESSPISKGERAYERTYERTLFIRSSNFFLFLLLRTFFFLISLAFRFRVVDGPCSVKILFCDLVVSSLKEGRPPRQEGQRCDAGLAASPGSPDMQVVEFHIFLIMRCCPKLCYIAHRLQDGVTEGENYWHTR